MRTSGLPLRVLAASLAAFACFAAPAAADPAHAGRASAEQALDVAEDAIAGRGVDTGRELSPALLELARGFRALPRAERSQARSLLTRPTDGGSDPQGGGWTVAEAAASPHCTANFCVHWVDSSADAPSPTDSGGAGGVPDYVETMASEFEFVRQVENGAGAGQLGWAPPKNDGDGKTDVYISDLAGNLFGYAAPDPQPNSASLYGYLVMDDDYVGYGYGDPLQPLRVTAAHEYNHVLQFNYDAIQDTWMFESTAVWAEEKVYDSVNDYLYYLPSWAGCSEAPLTAADPAGCSLKMYGSGVWNIWLDERYGSDVIRNAWSGSTSTTPAHFAPKAYDSAIAAGPGESFFDEFTRFSATMAEWRAPGGLSEGSLIGGDVERVASLGNGSSTTLTLDHTTFSLVSVPVPSASELHMTASFPSGTAGALALVARTGASPSAGTVTTELRQLPNGGSGSVTLANPGSYGRITAVLVNAATDYSGWNAGLQDWNWTKDDMPVGVALSTAAPPTAPTVDPPDTAITSAPPALSSSSRATFEFSASASGTRFECSIDGSAYFSCASPHTVDTGDGEHVFRVAAIDAAGRRDSTPASHRWTVATPDSTAPVIDQLALAPESFRVGRGTRVAYGLTEDAGVSFAVERLARGRRVRDRCVKPSRRNRRRRDCTRVAGVGSFDRSGSRGLNEIRFTGRVASRTLRPGRYRLKLVATDAAGNASAPRRTSFKVKR